ncbi:MAG TPA: hypothetical protein VGK73_40050 [Polyangiaceae bacterium]
MAVLVGLLSNVAPARAQTAKGRDVAPPPEEALSDAGELARIASLVEAAKYEECAARLERLVDPNSSRPITDPEVLQTALVYQATCYLGLGKAELVDEPLRQAIRKNPQMRAPDSLVFPQRVVARFLKVREEMFSELQASAQAAIDKARREAAEKQRRETEEWANLLVLQRMAREEVVVTKNRRWIGFVPFGVGQFQNGNAPLGWGFFAVETALAATALTATAVYTYTVAEVADVQQRGGSPAPEVSGRVHDWHLALTLSTYGLLGVAAIGIVEAQASFVPEVRTVRERKLPVSVPAKRTSLRIAPDVAAGPSGVSLGVRGSF